MSTLHFWRRIPLGGTLFVLLLGAMICHTSNAFVPPTLRHYCQARSTSHLSATNIPFDTFNSVSYSNGFRASAPYSSASSTAARASVECNFSDFLNEQETDMDQVARIYEEAFGDGPTCTDSSRAREYRERAHDVDWTRAYDEVRSYAAWQRPRNVVIRKYYPEQDFCQSLVIDIGLAP